LDCHGDYRVGASPQADVANTTTQAGSVCGEGEWVGQTVSMMGEEGKRVVVTYNEHLESALYESLQILMFFSHEKNEQKE